MASSSSPSLILSPPYSEHCFSAPLPPPSAPPPSITALAALASSAHRPHRGITSRDRSISRSHQFVVYAEDPNARSAIAMDAEDVKDRFLKLIDSEDRWKRPIVIQLATLRGGGPPAPPLGGANRQYRGRLQGRARHHPGRRSPQCPFPAAARPRDAARVRLSRPARARRSRRDLLRATCLARRWRRQHRRRARSGSRFGPLSQPHRERPDPHPRQPSFPKTPTPWTAPRGPSTPPAR